jgi:uncharacterized protein (TIGR02118 family)
MGHTLLVLYRQPEDPEAFRKYYVHDHLPLARVIPGVRNIRYTVDVTGVADESPYIAMFEADFDSAEAMAVALQSAQGQRAQADVANFATHGADILHYPHKP